MDQSGLFLSEFIRQGVQVKRLASDRIGGWSSLRAHGPDYKSGPSAVRN